MPFIVVGLFIYFLIRKSESLADELKAKDGEEKLKELKGEQKQIDTNANDAVSEYERDLKSYLSGSPGEVRKSGGSSESPNPDSGSGTKPE
jgi:hypothetical protein